MSPDSKARTPIVFIHGLWLHAESWARWIEFFRANGYDAFAANWPGDGETAEATRQNPEAVANYGITEIADFIAAQVEALDAKPILIGHSFGGLLVQNLLGRDLGVAAVAIDPAPIKGVLDLPVDTLKTSFPVLGNPFNLKRAVSLTEEQFHFGFTNAVTDEEAHQLYEKYAIPGPGRPIFQAATAAFNPHAANKVNVTNSLRGPLLLISGSEDHTVPPVIVDSTLREYKESSDAVTELKRFVGRGHSLTIDSGWQEVAEYILQWLKGKQL